MVIHDAIKTFCIVYLDNCTGLDSKFSCAAYIQICRERTVNLYSKSGKMC